MAATKTLPRRRLDWPLLGKELLEQAARKQMYIVRVLYAMLLFGAFCIYYMQHMAEGPVLVLGRGRDPFNFLFTAQMLAIYLFLPPLMAGALAHEKERETLGLLFLTDLTPWELILQKYFGRLIPMLTLLFLSLPLMAVSYSLGGVSVGMLYYAASTLFLTCLAVGALALECSAHEATTFQALIRTWGLCLLFGVFCWLGPMPIRLIAAASYQSSTIPFAGVVFNVIVYLIPTYLFLNRARQILHARAFVARRNPFGHQFKQLDQYWTDVRKLVRAVLKNRDKDAYADAQLIVARGVGDGPNAGNWSPGSYLMARQQVPHVLAFAMIFGVIVVLILIGHMMLDPKSGSGFVFIVSAIWILGLLTVPIQSANAVASERMNERLGAMLTSPLAATEILREWLGPVGRWTKFLVRPLVVIFAIEAIVKFNVQEPSEPRLANVALYLLVSLLTVWVYPSLVQWSCLWFGLRIRSQLRALMTSLLVVVAWCVLPLVAFSYLTETRFMYAGSILWLRYLSPVAVIGTAEAIGRPAAQTVSGVNAGIPPDSTAMALTQIAFAAVLALVIRWLCLRNGDRYMGRV
jgi:ABC-type transport system involved in multi-copper enzyme maturation permease subunit